jgi:hypothetical protein
LKGFKYSYDKCNLNPKVERALKSTYTPKLATCCRVCCTGVDMPEPLMVGVPWNAISTLLSFLPSLFDKPLEVGTGLLKVLTERTFWENQRLSNGSPFSQKGPSWKTQVVQWVSVFTQKDLSGKRRFAQWAFIFFGRGLLWKQEVVPLTYAFTRRTFLENEVVQWTSFFHRRDLHGKLKGPKRVHVFTKGSFMENSPSVSIMH